MRKPLSSKKTKSISECYILLRPSTPPTPPKPSTRSPTTSPTCTHTYYIHIPNILLRGRQACVALSNAYKDVRASDTVTDGCVVCK